LINALAHEVVTDLPLLYVFDHPNLTVTKENGYNTSCGGDGCRESLHSAKRPHLNVTDEMRRNLSKNNSENPNITECIRDDKLVGYRVRINYKQHLYEKRFTSTKFTTEENYKKAEEYLDDIKNERELTDTKNNKTNDCPTSIFPKKIKGEHAGYEVNLTINHKKYTKNFTSKQFTLEQKLQMAIDWKEETIKNVTANEDGQITPSVSEQANQQPEQT
jgi:hypothetical protein